MAIIPQISIFEYEDIEKLGDLERFKLALEGIDDEALMQKLEGKRDKGRDDYPVRKMWNMFIAMRVFEHIKVEPFRRELARNSQLRRACGLHDGEPRRHLVPPSGVFSRFLASLVEEQEEIDRIFDTQVSQLYELVPGFGGDLAGDGKYIDSVANGKPKEGQSATDNRSENDAQWSKKEYHWTDSNGKKQTRAEYHFGFKTHILCDVKSELPIGYSVTAANADERAEMLKILDSAVISDEYRRAVARHLMLDRGYDSGPLIKTVKDAGIIPVVDIRNAWKDGEATKQYKDTNIVYDYKGAVYYVDDKCDLVKMKYEGYDKQKKCLRYSHEGKTYKIYISYDERVFLPIARDSDKFARLYKGRTSVERLNARIDRDYMLEDHCIRGLKKTRLMVSLSLVIMNGMAIGKMKNGKTGIRSLKTAA